MVAGTIGDSDGLAELIRRVRTLRADSPRKWGRMTPHQAVCHVSDALRMALGDAPQPPCVDNWFTRNIVRRVALHSPLPWPRGVKTVRGFDQAAGEGTPPKMFEADADELIRLHERLAAKAGSAPACVHPIFGPLTSAEWMTWAYRHADHHLWQFGA